jgi:beta-N-acetylhexosaminidase
VGIKTIHLLVFLALLWVSGCTSSIDVIREVRGQRTAPPPNGHEAAWVDATLASLTLRQQVAQLIIQWLPGSYSSTSSPEFLEWANWVRDEGIGGIYLSIGLPHSYAAKINELQMLAHVPLLVASDFENGGPGMRINHSYALPSMLPQGGGTSFSPTMAFGAIGEERFVQEYGRITAVEAKAVGVHLNFAPVLDVNSNPNNPIINTRSFGEDPVAVAKLGSAYIQGIHEGGVLATAKHFPGHGDTHTDSHLDLPVVSADWDRLNSVELVPFRKAVESGVDAVMTAHLVVSGVQGTDGLPATLDSVFMTTLLREEMGFEGLLLTDALNMGALAGRYDTGELAVLALEAGNDVLLMPTDITEAIEAVVTAVEMGRIDPSQIKASVRRILEIKARVGLHRTRIVDLDAVDDVVGNSYHIAFADTVASRSMTLLRDRAGVVPVDAAVTRNVLSVTYARTNNLVAGTAFDQTLAGWVASVSRVRVSPDTPIEIYDSIRSQVPNFDLVMVSAYVPPRAGVGELAVPEAFADFVRKVGGKHPLILTSFGNPYLLVTLPETPSYLIAWGDREVSQVAAVRALFGETAIDGRLPISIPPFHAIGDGLTRSVSSTSVNISIPISATAGVTTVSVSQNVDGSGANTESAMIEFEDKDHAGAVAVSISESETEPELVGMSSRRLRALDYLIMEALADGVAPGAVLAVGRGGKMVRLRGYGRLDWDVESAPALMSSIYDLASLTKVVGTTTAAMILVDEGRLDLETAVVDYLPWWDKGDSDKAGVTVRHLLLHRAGLPPFRRFYVEMEGRDAYENAIGDLPLEYMPGDRTVYSDIGLMTMAFVIEEVTGQNLDVFLEEKVWKPLEMADTGFRPSAELLGRIAPTEVDTIFRDIHVHGVVHDENAYAIGGVAGHAGLFSTAFDLSVFAQAFLNGGMSGDVRIVSDSVLRLFTKRYDLSSNRALGWDTPSDRSSAGDYFTSSAFGHTGFTGTSIWIDPELDLFVVLLTNRVNPTRDQQKHIPLRRAVHDAVALAITDLEVRRREP